MPGQINRVPDGVMGFLGIKNFGRAPSELSAVLAGTWDLTAWYLNANVQWAGFNLTALPGTGNFIMFTVPLNEIWYVTNVSLLHTAAAASGNVCNLSRYGQLTTQITAIGPSYRVTASQSNQFGTEQPFILGAGESVGLACIEFTGTGQYGGAIRYRSMQV